MRYLWYIALLQFAMCFLPLAFEQFVHFFEIFLGIIGGIFIPLWTIVVLDYYVVRRMRVTDEDLFAGERSDGTTLSRLGDWNVAGWVAMGLGFGTFILLGRGLPEIAAVTTAAIPALVISGVSYLLLTLAAGIGKKTRVA